MLHYFLGWRETVGCVFSRGLSASQFSQKSCKCSHSGSCETLGNSLSLEYITHSFPRGEASLLAHRGKWGTPPPTPGICLLLLLFPLPVPSFFLSSSLPISRGLFFLYFYIYLARWEDSRHRKDKSRCSKIVYQLMRIEHLRASHMLTHSVLTISLRDRNFRFPQFYR